MQKLLFLFPIFFSYSLFSQNGPINPLSVRSNSVANASVAFTGINSLFNNQAGLADLEQIGLLFSGEQTFITPYSNNLGGGFAIPTTSGTFGMQYHYFGFGGLRQSKIGLAYARKLTEQLSVGAQFDLLNTQLFLQEKKHLFTFEVGFQYEVNKKILIGIHLYNPPHLEIIEEEFLPRILRLGATYTVLKKLMVHAELEKDFEYPLVFKSGIEFELAKDLWVRAGCQYKPLTINFGFGYLLKKRFRIDWACSYQHEIDYTPRNLLGQGFIASLGVGIDFY